MSTANVPKDGFALVAISKRRTHASVPRWSFVKFFRKNGGDDETRTRDLCRDSTAF